ncbi:MAG: MFS transporter [Candidatus Dormibacteria bacterium]
MIIRPVRSRLAPALGSLRAPAFRWWFLSQVLSASGTMTQGVAQSWLVLRLTGSGLDLGILGSCYMLPVLLGGPWAGALVDRVDRRRLLAVTQVLFILLAGALALLTFTGAIRVWMLFVLAFATGAVSAPDGAARQVYVLDLVGGERLASAVSLNEVVLNVSRVLGPATGGIFLATLGVPFCFVANAVSYLPPLAVLIAQRRRVSQGAAVRRAPGGPGAVRAGLRYAWHTPALRYCLLMAAASGMLFNLGVGLPLLATRTYHLGGGGYGLMMATFGVGGVAGALLAASGRGMPSGRSVRLLALLTGVSILATAAAPLAGLAFTGLGITGALSIWFIARANTLAQLRAAPSMRGRVMGIWVMALPGAQPITSPVVGFTAEAAGPRAGFGLAGVALLAVAAAGWRSLADAGVATEPAAGASTAPDASRPGLAGGRAEVTALRPTR